MSRVAVETLVLVVSTVGVVVVVVVGVRLDTVASSVVVGTAFGMLSLEGFSSDAVDLLLASGGLTWLLGVTELRRAPPSRDPSAPRVGRRLSEALLAKLDLTKLEGWNLSFCDLEPKDI